MEYRNNQLRKHRRDQEELEIVTVDGKEASNRRRVRHYESIQRSRLFSMQCEVVSAFESAIYDQASCAFLLGKNQLW